MREAFARIGFYLLGFTLFMISNQRMISLYSLGLFLFTGFILWLFDFKGTLNRFKARWYLFVPPLIYFSLYLISLILQKGNVRLLETYLMFLFIPLLGFTIISHEFAQKRINILLKLFVAGLIMISLFLIIRIVVIFFINVPEEQTFTEYFNKHNPEYVSWGFSVLEHPTYLSLKLIFAFIILFFNADCWKIRGYIKWGIFLIFTLTIFLLASKAGILAWIVTTLFLIIVNLRKKSISPAAYLVILSFVIGLTIISVKKLERISFFIVYTQRGLAQKNFDWKNLDQRTRNWYAASVLIKNKPLTGNGIVRTEERMVEVYNRNGFTEEAKLMMNAHNQFLEAQMTFGIAGIIALFWMLLTPVLYRHHLAFRSLAVPFIILFSFFSLFESMLNRQWGIMFFLLFYFIILAGFADESKP
jgi:hypothetical protein